ncbi:MAG: hypothetical protein ACYSTW_08595 [Planctomycetota bacterium]|jgi:type II secretory pathway component PulK
MYAKNQSKQKGIALIVAMLFVMVFSALSVAMFSMSSGNSLVASNLHKVNAARSSASLKISGSPELLAKSSTSAVSILSNKVPTWSLSDQMVAP